MKNVADIAVEVDKLVQNQDVRTRFLIHIDRFYAMSEAYGRSLQPYLDELKKTKAQVKQYTPKQIQEYRDQHPDSPGINLYDVCPPPEGWIKTDNSCCNSFFEFDYLVSYRPTEYPNPVLWLGVVGSSAVQRKPTDTEKLTCAYVLLAIARDYNLNKDLNTPIFQPEYKGKWFKRDTFFNPNAMKPTIWTKYFENLYNVSSLNRALGRVLSDIESHNQSAGKDSQSEQGKEWSKPMSKTRMMTALGMYSTDTFNSYANRIGIRHINFKTHQLCLDTLSPEQRDRIQKA
jgi:hypothetical protein